MKKAIFAGGCFWCINSAFDGVRGVSNRISGYIGGNNPHPTYEEVCKGHSGHYEAVEITYDPSIISYPQLLGIFWRNIDPLDKEGQFADKGSQYYSAIFYLDEEQKSQAEHSKQELALILKIQIVTEIIEASEFYPAEDYHQDYHKKNPERYYSYHNASGRKERDYLF